MGEKKKTDQTGRKALYRTYRSKSLDEIIGQEHVTRTLSNALKAGKISHAYLFTGPRGTGKTSIARIIAHAINDLPYTDESNHLDIIEIDAASNRRIDDIRDLRDKVHIAPVSAKYKVYIIDEVHMLTTESFNALLKTLEEPPEHVVFILATTEVHKLPATIISRTQRHSLRLVSTTQVAKHLKTIAQKEAIPIDPNALELLAEHGGGSFRDSISLLDQMSGSTEPITTETVESLLGLAPRKALESVLSAVQSGDGPKLLQQLHELLQSGLTAAHIAQQLVHHLRSEALSNHYNTTSIQIMEELVAIPSSHYPQLQLETTLLRASLQNQHTSPKTSTTSIKNTPSAARPVHKEEVITPKPPQELPEEQNNRPSTQASPTKKTLVIHEGVLTAEILEASWPKILEITKQKNNPLYTVLRLAATEADNEGLVLIFRFAFHQKKIDESRYKSLIAEIVAEVTGISTTVRSIIDKERAKPVGSETTPPVDTAHASLISQVQDIMGGGEVVQV